MSSMISPGDSIPHKIIETTMLLEIQEKKLETLKRDLEMAQRECDRLKDQLEMYQNAANPGPITKCPEEVLSIIFKLCIKDDPTHIHSLLLVCRYWHRLLIGNPQMWNVIKLKVPEEECWDMYSWANSASAYIKKCLKSSQSAALHIEVDFEDLLDIEGQLALRLKHGFQGLPSVVQSDYDLYYITQWARGLYFGDLLNYEDLTVDCKPEHTIDIIKDLIGPEERSTDRWKTLKVIFPTAYKPSRVWELTIAHSFPNLNRVSLEGLWIDDQINSPRPLNPVKFPAVEDLELGSGAYDNILPLFPTSLRTLSLEACFESQCVRSLSRLTQLRMLKMNVTSESRFKTDETDINPNLSLPLLQELHLIGDFRRLHPVELDLPSLRLVEIQCSEWCYNATNLPVLKPLQLRSVIGNQDSDCHAKSVLRLLLLHFNGTKNLIVAFQRKGVLLDLVQELAHEGLLPAAWETLSLHDNDQVAEVIEIRGMINNS